MRSRARVPERYAIGVAADDDLDAVAAAVGRALGVDLHERYGLNIGGGRYFSNWSPAGADPEIHVITNYGPDEAQWKYEEDQDVPYVVDVWCEASPVDVDDVIGRLTRAGFNCRVVAAC